MRELNLTAVGSSPLIADEIKSITQSFLGGEIFISTKTTHEVADVEENIFYVCAKTQENFLREKIPAEKLFVFDLHPTTKFFLDIAKIPNDEKVFVFNNRLPYTKLLAEECVALGITRLKFFPIAYDDMPTEEVFKRLQEADYIIGIECLTGEQMLLSKKYRPYLKANVKIISGKRAASVASAGRLLDGIAEFYYRTFLAERENLQANHAEKISELSKKIFSTINILRSAVNSSVTSQVGGNGDSKILLKPPSSSSLEYLDEQLKFLLYLKQKIHELCPM